MKTLLGAGKGRARLVGIPANRNDQIDRLTQEWFQRFAAQVIDGQANFCKSRQRIGVHVSGGLGSGRVHLPTVTTQFSPDDFSHLRTAGIACAEDQDAFHRALSCNRKELLIGILSDFRRRCRRAQDLALNVN